MLALWLLGLLSSVHFLYMCTAEAIVLDNLPLFLLLFMMLDRSRVIPSHFKSLSVILLLVSGFLFFGEKGTHFRKIKNSLKGHFLRWKKPLAPRGFKELTTQRAKGIIVPEDVADEIDETVAYIQSRTQENENVYFFGMIEMLAFLCDRSMPISFHSPYNAPTPEAVDLIIQELKDSSIRYVVLDLQMESKGGDVQEKFPELWNYIQTHYHLDSNFPNQGKTYLKILRLHE